MKKKHLFICHAGQHMIFAQCIAMGLPEEDEKVLWLCPQSANSRLWDTFTALEVPGLWTRVEKKSYMWDLAFSRLGRQVKRLFFPFLKFYITAKKLAKELHESRFNEVWICHPLAPFCALAAQNIRFNRGNISFFEEGLSVYQWVGLSTRKPKRIGYKAYGRLRNRLLQWLGVQDGNCGKAIEELVDRVYFIWPKRKHIYSHLNNVKALSLLDFCNQDSLGRVINTASIGKQLRAVANTYPKDPFVLLLLSVEVEDNFFEWPDYLKGLKKALVRNVPAGLQVIIKKHPRSQEKVIKRAVELINEIGFPYAFASEPYPVPIELLYPLLNCQLVIGGISSPLLYLPRFYNARCISALNYMDEGAFLTSGKITPETAEIYKTAA